MVVDSLRYAAKFLTRCYGFARFGPKKRYFSRICVALWLT